MNMSENDDKRSIILQDLKKILDGIREDFKNLIAQIEKHTEKISDISYEQKTPEVKSQKSEVKHLKIHLSIPVHRNVYPPRCFDSAIIPRSMSNYLTTKIPIAPWDPPPFPDDD